MKITPSCVACIIDRRAVELETLLGDEQNKVRLSILRSVIESTNLYIGPDIEAAEFATVAFRRVKKLANIVELYEKLIARYVNMAIDRAKKIYEQVEGEDRSRALRTLLRAAAAAAGFRVIHQASALYEPPEPVIPSSLPVGIDDSEKVEQLLSSSEGGTVYYVLRSVTEAPYDAVLARFIRDNFSVKVVAVVKIERFEDHVTMSDLEEYELAQFFDDIIEVGSDAATIIEDEAEHVIQELNSGNLVIVKGGLQSIHFLNNPLQTNTLMLFTATCRLLSRVFQVKPRSINIVLRGRGLG